jgi:hypothetical protein
MHRPLPRLLLPALLLAGLALAVLAQGPPESGPKKGEVKKGEPAKSGEPAKGKEKEPSKAKVEKWPFAPGTILIVPKEFEKGLPSWTGIAVLPLEELLKLREAADKQKGRPEKKLAHSCELTGRLEGDYVALRGEFTFATEEPRTIVTFGLQGGQLSEKGELDGQMALMDHSADDGFTARIDEPGNHRLVLHLRVPVTSKRPTGGSGLERALDLGLPGTVITTIALELPAAVKEVRFNDLLEKTRTPGKWLFAVGKRQTLTLSWREPAPQQSGGPHLAVDGKIKVGLLGADVEVSAELELVDPRGQTKECQLIVPAQAEVKVDAPPGLSYLLLPPGPKNPYHLLRFLEPNAEPWKVTVFARLPRPAPGGRLAVGPFYVQGAEQQRGTITVVATADLLRKQRFIYYRHGEVFQRDPPKGQENIEALFQYWGLPDPAKAKSGGASAAARVPLEIELKSERGPLEAAVNQVLKLRPSSEGWEIDLSAQITVKSPFGGGDFLDLQLPRPRPTGAALVAAAPWSAFPAALPWGALALMRGPLPAWAVPLEFHLSDDGGGMLELPVPDGRGRCRVPLPKGLTLKLTGKYAVAPDSVRARVDLPRVLGLVEQGSKVTILADEALELLDGPHGWEMPVQEKQRYQFAVDTTPPFVDVAWRPYRPEFPATALVDLVIHGQTAQVRQRLTYGALPRPGPAQPSRSGQIELQVPPGVQGLTYMHGKERTKLRPEKATGTVWLAPHGEDRKEVVLEYDLPLATAEEGKDGPRKLDMQIIWPRRATRQQAKVRIWCEPGARVRLAGAAPGGGLWRDRGVEAVKDHDLLPALVLEADGTDLALALQIDTVAGSGVVPLICERALIAADVGGDGGLQCRARYVVSKVNTEAIAVEFPVPVRLCQPEARIGEHAVAPQPVDGNERAVRVPLPRAAGGSPLILEIKYQLPKSTQEGRVFGLVTLVPPVFSAPVRHLRWHLNLPTGDVLAAPLTAGARPDYRWGFNRGFSPEPAVSEADLESWLLGNGPGGEGRPSGLTFWPAGPEPQRVCYLPRLFWLVAVSVLAVVLFLVLYFLRLSRVSLVVLVGLVVVAGLALALTWPALLVALCYGAQPGLLVIVAVLAVLWWWQQRYHRQLVFIPGFTRIKAGSSLIRNGKSSKRPREASTIDAPASSGAARPESTSSKK